MNKVILIHLLPLYYENRERTEEAEECGTGGILADARRWYNPISITIYQGASWLPDPSYACFYLILITSS